MQIARTRLLMSLGLATLALRSLIPLGYMPGDLLAGEFVVLCPTGVPLEVMRQLHRGHHDHDAKVVDVDQSCPVGSALQPAWLPAPEPAQLVLQHASDKIDFYPLSSFYAIHARRYDSRGPPLA